MCFAIATLACAAAAQVLATETAARVVGVEKQGLDCAIGELPGFESLPTNRWLPDPFLRSSGERITKKTEWPCRRAEIAAQVAEYQLGPKPPRSATVGGQMTGNQFTVLAAEDGREISFSATIVPPRTGTPPYPVMIVLGGRTWLDHDQTLSQHGVAIMNVDVGKIAEQQDAGSRGKGQFYELYPEHPAGAMMAWAWGISRIVDALESTPESDIDATRIGVTGCSRYGKGALVAGAFDERIALTISQESGAGGASLWRLADVNQQAWIAAGKVPEHGAVQTLAQIVNENTWFRDSFRQFSQAATRLPFDQHMVMALIAPRALLVLNNTDMWWLDRQGSHLGALTAHSVWQALGIPERMGTRQVGGHPHCSGLPQAQLDAVGAYVARFLAGQRDVDTSVLYTDGDFPDIRSTWIRWDTPDLE